MDKSVSQYFSDHIIKRKYHKNFHLVFYLILHLNRFLELKQTCRRFFSLFFLITVNGEKCVLYRPLTRYAIWLLSIILKSELLASTELSFQLHHPLEVVLTIENNQVQSPLMAMMAICLRQALFCPSGQSIHSLLMYFNLSLMRYSP